MVVVDYKRGFRDAIKRLRDNSYRDKIKKQILKIKVNPKIGKPMSYNRRGTREVYIKPFRLSYTYLENEDKIIFFDLYHKKKQ